PQKPNSSIPRGPNHFTPKETNMENSKKSFVFLLKRGSQSHVTPEITKPALVLDETCIKEFDFGMSLMGRAKDVSAIPNLPCIISKEGFQNVKLSYLGGMWVLFEFDSLASKEKFLNHSGIGSWFMIINERQKVIIQGKVYWIRVKELDAWFLNFQEDDQEDLSSDGESQEGDVANKTDNNESGVDRVSESSFMHENDTAHKDKSKVGGSILDLMDELVTIGQTMGYNMAGLGNKAKRRWIKELCQKHRINFASIQETKAESISLHTIKDLWENQMFDHEGDNAIMGDFNKVRSEHQRFGSTFNRQWAIAFNNFISSACLIDLPLEGYAFTWAHKSASKMSKLDSYLLREINFDYGPSPFRFFHSWFAMEGFNYFVETTWKSLNIVEPNGLIRLKKKLQALKIAIKAWSKERNDMEISQKAKIRWSIEGDENSKYFHVQDLERTVTYEEVKRAVWDCGTNKSPGPDGFSFEFYPFVANRQILDGHFILNGLLSWCKFKKLNGMIFKVDFEKAFDSVKWDYLDETLKAFGFGSKWPKWISSCLNNPMGSVLVNGSPTLEFQFHKGLKQGDPISPFLFILIMETLHLTFKRVLNADLYKGVSLNDSFTISYLFYADDVVFIGEWNNNNIQTLLSVLRYFYLASGIKINLHKSKLMGICVSSNVVAARGVNRVDPVGFGSIGSGRFGSKLKKT
nr:RNA-directed DNA polymerase, eukaryota, reverse transcriptase zinc-binding domain protein [Tanacetum cinerariifolium]